MPRSIEGRFYTVEDVANARNISVQGVRKAIKEKRLTAEKIAHTWFIREEELKKCKWIR
jgi:hypothetical protein